MRLLSGASENDIEERRLFSEWVLAIGDWKIGQSNGVDITVDIPPDLLVPNSGDPLASIVESTYPILSESMNDISYF